MKVFIETRPRLKCYGATFGLYMRVADAIQFMTIKIKVVSVLKSY